MACPPAIQAGAGERYFMDLRLEGKTAVVTGGTRGIGRATAALFAAEGAKVAICARDGERVAATVRHLERQKIQAFGATVDVTDGAALQAFIHEAAETLDGIDIYVANASTLAAGNHEAAWRLAFESDVIGTVEAAAAVNPYLECGRCSERRRGISDHLVDGGDAGWSAGRLLRDESRTY
jgi:3-oxoacyl-[acyl-carrier protein] reductase